MKALKEWWHNLFKPKEVKMPAGTDNRAVKALKQQVATQNEQIGRLKNRVGTLVDDMTIIERDVARFKKQVSSDIKMLVEKINK